MSPELAEKSELPLSLSMVVLLLVQVVVEVVVPLFLVAIASAAQAVTRRQFNLQLNSHLAHVCLFVPLIFTDKAITLHNVRVNVPRAVERGDDANFICNYNLDADQTLYSVKWYKGRREFYRFTPNEIPPMKTFPVAGISVFVSMQCTYMFIFYPEYNSPHLFCKFGSTL